MVSFTEENYLKAIFHLFEEKDGATVSTNDLAEYVQNRAASVTDMLKKLAEKDLINYKKYQGVTLTNRGQEIALRTIRKHRLWEVFLVDKLGFKWDQIHEIAEQLEHIKSEELTNRLEHFLDFPSFDPHGDPIPDINGKMPKMETYRLSEAPLHTNVIIKGVAEDTTSFLQHLDKLGLNIDTTIAVVDKSSFDLSCELQLADGQLIRISHEVAVNIQVNSSL